MMWFLYLTAFTLIFLVWRIFPYYLWYLRSKEMLDPLPGVKIKGLLADAHVGLMQKGDACSVATNCMSLLPRLFRDEGHFVVWISFIPHICICQADDVETILSSNSLITKSKEYKSLDAWLGKGLITSNGSDWRKHRKILTPAFHFRILEEFIPIVNEQANILVQTLEKSLTEPWVDMMPLVTRCTLDIICETSMGIQLGSQHHKEVEYVQALQCVQESFLWRNAMPWLKPNLIFYSLPMGWKYLKNLHVVQSFTKQVIQQRKAEILQSGWKNQNGGSAMTNGEFEFVKSKTRLAFLDLLLYYHMHDKDLTEKDVLDQVNTFMFAGHDTTSHGIAWTLYLLGLHPEYQAKVHAELDEIFGEDTERPATTDDLKKMKYLECTIKESQRLYPPVPLIARKTTEEVIISDRAIPKGISCIIFINALHRDPKMFPNPHRFVPDRFTLENSKGRHPFAFVPFSAGPRNCIGQRFAMNEEKILISAILRKFIIKSMDHQDKITVDGNVVLKPTCPIRIVLSPRNNVAE